MTMFTIDATKESLMAPKAAATTTLTMARMTTSMRPPTILNPGLARLPAVAIPPPIIGGAIPGPAMPGGGGAWNVPVDGGV